MFVSAALFHWARFLVSVLALAPRLPASGAPVGEALLGGKPHFALPLQGVRPAHVLKVELLWRPAAPAAMATEPAQPPPASQSGGGGGDDEDGDDYGDEFESDGDEDGSAAKGATATGGGDAPFVPVQSATLPMSALALREVI